MLLFSLLSHTLVTQMLRSVCRPTFGINGCVLNVTTLAVFAIALGQPDVMVSHGDMLSGRPTSVCHAALNQILAVTTLVEVRVRLSPEAGKAPVTEDW